MSNKLNSYLTSDISNKYDLNSKVRTKVHFNLERTQKNPISLDIAYDLIDLDC